MTGQAVARSVVPGAGQWLGGRRTTGIAAVAVVALLVVLGCATWLRRADGGARQTSAASAPIAAEDGAPALAAPVTDGAAPGRADAEMLTAPPTGVLWQGWHSAALPYSAKDGPRAVRGDAASGFSRTPAGALLASVHAVWRLAGALDPEWRNVAGTMAAPGPGRDRWIAARAAVHLTSTQGPGAFAQVAGFQFVSYTEDDAAILLVAESGDRLAAQPVHVRWTGGDWRLVMTPGGDTGGVTQPVVSLDGYVGWGVTR